MYCKTCGHELVGNAAFCPKCGAPVISDETNEYQKKEPQSQQQQLYQQPSYAAQQPQKIRDNYAIASFVTGLVSIIIATLPLSILAIIFGTVSKHHGYTSKLATAGRIIGIITLSLSIIEMILVIVYIYIL